MVWVVASKRVSKSRRNSLTVTAISLAGAGLSVGLDRGGYGQVSMSVHGQWGPAVPGGPAPDVVLMERRHVFYLPVWRKTRPPILSQPSGKAQVGTL
jgi:hypothetical protein